MIPGKVRGRNAFGKLVTFNVNGPDVLQVESSQTSFALSVTLVEPLELCQASAIKSTATYRLQKYRFCSFFIDLTGCTDIISEFKFKIVCCISDLHSL